MSRNQYGKTSKLTFGYLPGEQFLDTLIFLLKSIKICVMKA